MPKINLSDGWRIVIKKSEEEVAWLAAVELQDTLKRIAGGLFPMSTNKPPDTPIFVLTHDDGENDGFCWRVQPNCIRLHGTNQRGLLYAVYSFLEALGCRWLAPGDEHTRLPRKKVHTLPEKETCETAAFPTRYLVIGHHAFMATAPEWVVWAARNRFNGIFFHVTESPYALGAAPESQYQRQKEAAVRLALQRGMTIEYGGHLMSSLLPRNLFRRMPNAFRLSGGRRTPDHNLCPTSLEGISTLKANAAEYFRNHSEVDVFHLWPDDLPGGGWCECDRCKDYTPAEQSMLITNVLAGVLKTVNPKAQISFLAYHDTEEPPGKVEPQPNVCLVWAPRRRCYAHAADEKDCPVNAMVFQERFPDQVKFMQNAGAAPVRVFEYYLDGILFKSVLPPLMKVMQEDMRFYRRNRIQAMGVLMTSDRPWHTVPLNAWMFGRLVWDPEQEVKDLVSDFSRVLLGKKQWDYYRALESAYTLALGLGEEQTMKSLSESGRVISALLHPPTDIGDPVHASDKILRKKAKKNVEILSLLEEAEKALEKVKAGKRGHAVQLEKEAFELHRAWLSFDLKRVQLYNAVALKKPGREVRALLKEAQKAYSEVLAWGEKCIEDKRYQRNFRFIHLVYWELQLNKIRVQYFPLLNVKFGFNLSSLIKLLAAKVRMKNLYKERVPPPNIMRFPG